MLQNIKELFTFQYYREGLSDWTPQTKLLWFVGTIILTFTGFLHGLDQWVLLSWAGGLIGFTTTLAITNGKRINGLLGFISAIMISLVAFHSKNFADIFMQIGYIIALDLPVIIQGKRWQQAKVRLLDTAGLWGGLIVWAISFVIMFVIDSHFGSPRPFIDAFSASIGFAGSYLMLKKYASQYVMWTLQGLMSATLWGITALQGDANYVLFAVYILYLANDVIGLFFSQWSHKNIKAEIPKQQYIK